MTSTRNSHRHFRSGVAVALLASQLAPVAEAQSAWSFACTITRVCDGAGNCRDARASVQFTAGQERLNNRGEGTLRLQIGETPTEVYSLSEIGPLVWAEADRKVHSLSLSGGDNAIWQVFDVVDDKAEIRFLRCEK